MRSIATHKEELTDEIANEFGRAAHGNVRILLCGYLALVRPLVFQNRYWAESARIRQVDNQSRGETKAAVNMVCYQHDSKNNPTHKPVRIESA